MRVEQAETQDALAAEYALGALHGAARRRFEAMLRRDPALAGRVVDWQERLAGLAVQTRPVEPPTQVLQSLMRRIESPETPSMQLPWWRRLPVWSSYGSVSMVSVAAGCVVTWTLLFHAGDPSLENALTQELTSAHVRSLMANHLSDVTASDRHAVKPWFSDKLDFSPPVEDLSQQAFPLVGGRLEYVQSRSAAALVYRRRKHIINLFVWPVNDASSEPIQMHTRQGYNFVHWQSAALAHWAVSDLNLKELKEFAELMRADN